MSDRQAVLDATRGMNMPCPAHWIAYLAKLPLERVYEVLVALESEGLAQVVAGHGTGRRPATREWRVM